MSDRRLGDTFYLDFATHDPATGSLGTPSTGPAVSVYEDGTDTPILTPSPAVRNSKTGLYKVAIAATSGNGFEFGKSYNVHAEYEFPGDIGSISQAQIIERFTLDSRLTGDLNNITAADVWAVATRTLTSFGTLAADVWTVVTRTLTNNGNDISITDVQTALTNQGFTTARGGYLDRLDAAVTTRASASDWTAGRAAKVDNLDVVLSTRAVEATVAKEATAVAGFAAGAKDATCAKETTLAGTPAATDAAITASHGVGSYVDSGAAPTTAAIDAALTAAHGAGSWQTGGGGGWSPADYALVNTIKMNVEQIFKKLGLRWGS